MLNITELDKDDIELVEKAKQFITENYKQYTHHVACILKCKDKLYYALHLDIRGFDVCAEPIALSNALIEKQADFDIIVAVLWTEKGAQIISLCGNCRQMFCSYTPNIQVIVSVNNQLGKIKATELLPLPY